MSREKTAADPGQAVLPGEERRRSQRVMIRTPVTLRISVANQPLVLKAETVAVNAHGAMLLCARTFPAEMKMEIYNERTRQRRPCRVTRTPHETPEGYLVPVEFETAAPDFWHISFPPVDAAPSNS